MAPPLQPGLYQIRYVPPHVVPPFVGGVRAVGIDLNTPILDLPAVPPARGGVDVVCNFSGFPCYPFP